MTEFNIEVPLNGLSFGQIGVNLLIEIYKRNLCAYVFPVGQTDFQAFDLPEGFLDWYNKSTSSAIKNIGRNLPTLRLWHFSGSHTLIPSSRNILFTAHECSETTDVERQICSLYHKVLFTSEYSKNIFQDEGVNNADYCPNFFDSNHFKKIDVKKQDGVINFSLIGKLEKRKNTHQILATWASKYGGNPAYNLNCLITNPFLPPEVNQRSIDGLFRGLRPFNINLIPHQQKNSTVNDLINFCDISIDGLSGAEGWNLPAFNSVCLGKQAIVLNAHGHKSWATSENSILVEPSGKQEIYDATFFSKGSDYNQGEMFTFDPHQVIKALESAEQKVRDGDINTEGMKLQEKFSVSNTLDIILVSLFD